MAVPEFSSVMRDVEADRDAALYEQLAPGLVAFATGLVGRQDAMDVFSSAVVKSLSAPGWASVENPRAYLYRAVVNEARTWHRRSAQRAESERRTAFPDQWELPEFRPEVHVAVERLSVQQRAVILLTYWADLDPRAVAEHLGISEGAVRRHLARARARLRKALDD